MATYPNNYRTAVGFLQNYTFFGVPGLYFYNSECGTGAGSRNNRFVGDGGLIPKTNSVPQGYGMKTPFPPIAAGEISSTGKLNGDGTTSFDGNLGLNAQATLTGSGDITSAVAQLVISMVANLTGSTSLSSADLRGYLNAVANISGGGTLASTIGALAWANAALAGNGTITNATPYATGTLSANIRGYSDLTPEGITDKVWNAMLANYPTSGSAGNTLALAGSGGVDYNALATAVWAYATRTLTSGAPPTEAQIAEAVMTYAVEAGWTTEELLRVFAAVLAGKVSGAGTGTEVFRDINDTKNRVTATTDSNGNRTNITLDAS